MKQKRTLLISAAGLALVLAAAALLYPRLSQQAAPSAGSDAGVELPDPIPAVDFTLENSRGEMVSFLEQLDGRPAVLNFWASTCGPCRQEMPFFQQAYETYGEDIQFLMVNVMEAMGDTREAAQEYLTEQGFTFPVYYDTQLDGVYSYGLQGFPTTFLLNEEGEVVLGYSGMMLDDLLQTYLHYAFPSLVEAPDRD